MRAAHARRHVRERQLEVRGEVRRGARERGQGEVEDRVGEGREDVCVVERAGERERALEGRRPRRHPGHEAVAAEQQPFLRGRVRGVVPVRGVRRRDVAEVADDVADGEVFPEARVRELLLARGDRGVIERGARHERAQDGRARARRREEKVVRGRALRDRQIGGGRRLALAAHARTRVLRVRVPAGAGAGGRAAVRVVRIAAGRRARARQLRLAGVVRGREAADRARQLRLALVVARARVRDAKRRAGGRHRARAAPARVLEDCRL